MCNANNHDPWCPCGWGPVRGVLGDKTSDELCKIFSPFNSTVKNIYEVAKGPIEELSTCYRNMGRIMDGIGKWEKASKKLETALRKAVGKMESYENDRNELVEKLQSATGEEERKGISAQIAQLDKSIDGQIKAAGVEHQDEKGQKNTVNSLEDLKKYFGNDSQDIRKSGMKEFYGNVGACDGFVRDKILRDVVGVNLNNSGSDVTGVKDLFDYCKKNKVDSQMNKDVYDCLTNNDKEGFKAMLTRTIVPGSMLFRSGSGSGALHTGVVKRLSYDKDGKLKAVVMVHAANDALETTETVGGKEVKKTGGIKSWTISVDDLWKSGAEYTRKYKDKDGKKQEEKYRRLFISNIAIHNKLQQN